jgi:hypothetical protein
MSNKYNFLLNITTLYRMTTNVSLKIPLPLVTTFTYRVTFSLNDSACTRHLPARHNRARAAVKGT